MGALHHLRPRKPNLNLSRDQHAVQPDPMQQGRTAQDLLKAKIEKDIAARYPNLEKTAQVNALTQAASNIHAMYHQAAIFEGYLDLERQKLGQRYRYNQGDVIELHPKAKTKTRRTVPVFVWDSIRRVFGLKPSGLVKFRDKFMTRPGYDRDVAIDVEELQKEINQLKAKARELETKFKAQYGAGVWNELKPLIERPASPEAKWAMTG